MRFSTIAASTFAALAYAQSSSTMDMSSAMSAESSASTSASKVATSVSSVISSESSREASLSSELSSAAASGSSSLASSLSSRLTSLAASDAALLGRLVDGVVLVIRAGQTERDAARQAVRQLAAGRARVLGAVLNDPDDKVGKYGGHYRYEYYGHKVGA